MQVSLYVLKRFLKGIGGVPKEFQASSKSHLDRMAPLSPKVFETLRAPVENNGRVLDKEELMQTIWPDMFVEESNPTQRSRNPTDYLNRETRR
jgi:DNA-binding response OmpR family regulator